MGVEHSMFQIKPQNPTTSKSKQYLQLERIFHLAWPSILSELSTPFLGLVDTLVVGHFAKAEDLAALALAIAAYNPLIVVFNFLRMGFGQGGSNREKWSCTSIFFGIFP